MSEPARPLLSKLGVHPGDRLVLLGAPDPLPAGLSAASGPRGAGPAGAAAEVTVRRRLGQEADVIVLFVVAASVLRRRFPAARDALPPAGGLWVAWPKRSSGVDTDLSDGVVREIGLSGGLVDNKVCAIDATWSALRFVRRRADRAASGSS